MWRKAGTLSIMAKAFHGLLCVKASANLDTAKSAVRGEVTAKVTTTSVTTISVTTARSSLTMP